LIILMNPILALQTQLQLVSSSSFLFLPKKYITFFAGASFLLPPP